MPGCGSIGIANSQRKNFFQTGQPKPPFNRNEVGATWAAPSSKTSFSSSAALKICWNAARFTTSALSLPTDAMRTGISPDSQLSSIPFSGHCVPNNQIPTNRIDSRAQALPPSFPQPERAGRFQRNFQNYVTAQCRTSTTFIAIGGAYGLHKASRQRYFFVNLNYSKGDPYFVAQNYPVGFGSWENGGYTTKSLNGTYFYTFRPTVDQRTRFGFLSHASVRQGMNRASTPGRCFLALSR